MFMFGARRYLQELARFAPEMARVCEAAFAAARADLEFTRIASRGLRKRARPTRSTTP